MKKTKLVLVFAVALAFSLLLMIGIGAENLWDGKPSGEPADSGYCYDWVNSQKVETNIKWELHNFGSETAPNYTSYFYIDESIDSTNTLISSQMNSDKSASAVNGYSWANEESAVIKKHPWYDSATISKIKNIVIADGITGFKNGTFVGMTSVEKIEMPQTLVSMNGSAFKGMNGLLSVYTRGISEPVSGVVDLSNLTSISFSSNYYFSGLKKIKEYKLSPDLQTSTNPAQYAFLNNVSLVSIDLTMIDFNEIDYNTFNGCTKLEEIFVTSKIATIKSPFQNCTSLKAIYSPVGSAAHTYALTNGYDTTHTIEVYDTVGGVENVHCATLTFDPDESHAVAKKVLKSGWWEFDPYQNASIKAFMNAYKNYAVSFSFDGDYGKIRSYNGLFSGFTKLESVCFAKSQRLVDWCGNGNVFAGCSSLTTVYFGDEADMVKGIADFSGMGIYPEDHPDDFTVGLFKNCTSLTDVILPKLNNSGEAPTIYTSTFEGCTSLRSVKIPETFGIIEDGAFSSCSVLT